MANATVARAKTVQSDRTVIPETGSLPIAANTRVRAGTIGFADSAGRIAAHSALASLVPMGVVQADVLNLTTDASGGAAGALQVPLKRGAYSFDMGAGVDAFTIADRMVACYASDDHTVNKTDAGGTRPFVGTVIDVVSGQAVVIVGLDLSIGGASPAPQAFDRGCRYVMTTNVASLAAFTVLQDGITGLAGEVVLLAGQTTKSQNGPYQIGTVVAGVAPLVRVSWLSAASIVKGGYDLTVNEGTLNANSVWFISTAGDITIGTTNHDWFPERITQSLALLAGTTTVSNVPILSVTKSNAILTRRIANTSALTVGGYCTTVGGASGVTAGVVGTAACIIEACVGAGTINNADISTLEVTIVNR